MLRLAQRAVSTLTILAMLAFVQNCAGHEAGSGPLAMSTAVATADQCQAGEAGCADDHDSPCDQGGCGSRGACPTGASTCCSTLSWFE